MDLRLEFNHPLNGVVGARFGIWLTPAQSSRLRRRYGEHLTSSQLRDEPFMDQLLDDVIEVLCMRHQERHTRLETNHTRSNAESRALTR